MQVKYEKLYDDIDIDKHIMSASEKYNNGNMEKMLGIGLNMPFECTNSASRKNMFASQYQQRVCLEEPEIPYVSTGYENIFGEHSSALIKADRKWRVMAKIEKFSNKPGHQYYLFIIDENNNMDVIERISYEYNTESYGFLYNNMKKSESEDDEDEEDSKFEGALVGNPLLINNFVVLLY